MKGLDKNLRHPVFEGYILAGGIVTSVSYESVRWAPAFGRLLGIKLPRGLPLASCKKRGRPQSACRAFHTAAL